MARKTLEERAAAAEKRAEQAAAQLRLAKVRAAGSEKPEILTLMRAHATLARAASELAATSAERARSVESLADQVLSFAEDYATINEL